LRARALGRARRVETLHDAAAVRARRLLVAPSGVLADDASPELLGLDVARELRDLPLAGKRVEHAPGDLAADTPTAVAPQDEELADVARAVPGEVGAVAREDEARQHAVGTHEVGRHPGIRPESLDRRDVAVEAVVADRPVVDGGEVVEVELHEPSQYRKIRGPRLSKLDLHRRHARLPLMRLARTIIGMVHLPPLPGSPRWDGSMPASWNSRSRTRARWSRAVSTPSSSRISAMRRSPRAGSSPPRW